MKRLGRVACTGKLRIWTADVSKQVIGQLFVHFLNLFISCAPGTRVSIPTRSLTSILVQLL